MYEANIPDTFRRPQTDTTLENFIRAKYEHKKYIAKEFVPTVVGRVDWWVYSIVIYLLSGLIV